MQNHKIGDSYIIHKIKPIPEGWVDRSNPIVGNKYLNEPAWSIFKDTKIQTYYDDSTSLTGRFNDSHSGVENSGVRYDGWKVLGMDYANLPSDLTYYSACISAVFSKSGHLTFILLGGSLTAPGYNYYYAIYRSKNPVVNEETDYGYFYQTLNTPDGLTIDDFTYTLVTSPRSSPSSTTNMYYNDYNGILNFGQSRSNKITHWYADDRNGTNDQYLEQVLYNRYNFETGSLFQVKYREFIAPRSLTKIPSSDPWAAQLNYAFDINNIDYMQIAIDYGAEHLDCHTLTPVFRCVGRVKEFYTVGFPEVPSFNYRDFEYYMSYGRNPIPCYYVNGGLVYDLRNIHTQNGAVFNNVYIYSAAALSDGYSSVSGVEISTSDMNFKTTEQLQKNYTAYDFDGKYLNQINRKYFGDSEQGMGGSFNDSNVDSYTMHYFHRKDMSLPIALPHMKYGESANYLIERPFLLSKADGFQFVGDDSFFNEMKQYQTFESSYYYEFMPWGMEYLYGGDVVQDMLLKCVQSGYEIGRITSNSDYYSSGPMYAGMDNEGYHVIMSHITRISTTNKFLNLIKTERVGGTTNAHQYYRVSPDYSIIQEFVTPKEHGSGSETISATNRYITKDWTNRPSYISTISGLIYNPVKQKDTYSLPQLNPNSGDFKYITKLTED